MSIELNKESVEQAGGDERAACNLWIAEQHLCQGSDISLFKLERNGALVSLHELLRDAYQAGQARAALAQPSPAQAEAERPEVVARVVHSNPVVLGQCGPLNANDELMTVAQHAASVARWAEMFNRVEQQRDAALARVAELEAKLAEMEKQVTVAWGAFHFGGERDGKLYTHCETEAQIDAYILDMHRSSDSLTLRKSPLYAAPVAQAQHSVPEGWVQSLPLKDYQPCKPNEDRANGYVIPIYSRPVPVEEALRKLRAVLCDPVGNVVIDGSDGDREEVQRALGMLAAAPGKEVGHE
ncbi:TPA: hypothetical protein SMV88_004909 [Pseudomonas aeruginosa]|nr:hypothetical protein [Pseudomonas aeruginosa]HEK3432640.1 hypothetical protein [Pseudomonas aeruginosa]